MKTFALRFMAAVGALSMVHTPSAKAEEAAQGLDSDELALTSQTQEMSQLFINEKTGEIIRVSQDGKTIERVDRSKVRFGDDVTASATEESSLVPRGGFGGFRGGFGGHRGGFGGYRGGFGGYRGGFGGYRGGFGGYRGGFGGFRGYYPGYRGYYSGRRYGGFGRYYGGWGRYGYHHRRHWGGGWYWPLYSCNPYYYPYNPYYCDYYSY